MKHPHSKSLSSDEVRKIRDAIKRILRKEGLSDIPLIFKSKVFSTRYAYRVRKDPSPLDWEGHPTQKEEFLSDESLQFGGKVLTGSAYPSRIYYLEYVDGEYRFSSISRPRNLMLATIVSSVILEEIAHASTTRRNIHSKAHGREFYDEFTRLWRKYFDVLQFQLIGIYGSEGDY